MGKATREDVERAVRAAYRAKHGSDNPPLLNVSVDWATLVIENLPERVPAGMGKTAGTPTPFVAQQLNVAAALFAERDKQYGGAYKRFGAILHALFPEGVRADGPEDMGRLALVLMQVAKLNRYTANFGSGGHDDSLDDLAVYSMMLKELDRDALATKGTPFRAPAPAAGNLPAGRVHPPTDAEEEFLGGYEEREDQAATERALKVTAGEYRAKREEMERARDQYAREADSIAAERAHHKAALAAARKQGYFDGFDDGRFGSMSAASSWNDRVQKGTEGSGVSA